MDRPIRRMRHPRETVVIVPVIKDFQFFCDLITLLPSCSVKRCVSSSVSTMGMAGRTRRACLVVRIGILLLINEGVDYI